MDEIQRNDLRHENPIKVDKHFNILEGQHTFVASKNLGLSIIYQHTNMTVTDIGMFNSVQKNWSSQDTLNHFCVQGLEDYKILFGFYKKYPYPISTLLILLTGENSRGILKDYKRGLFRVKQSVGEVQGILDKIMDFKEYNDKVFRHKSFVLAYFDLLTHPEFNHELLVHKVSVVPEKFIKQDSQVDYLRMLEDIYNYRNRKPVRFF